MTVLPFAEGACAEGTRVFTFRPAISADSSSWVRAEGVWPEVRWADDLILHDLVRTTSSYTTSSYTTSAPKASSTEVVLPESYRRRPVIAEGLLSVITEGLLSVIAEGLLSVIAEGLLSPKALHLTLSATLYAHNSVMPDPFEEFLGSLERAGRALSNETLTESRRYESEKF